MFNGDLTLSKKQEIFSGHNLSHLSDPWLMKDMDKAVNRILTAKSKNEKILVYGDYDVDGTTSVASMYQFLKVFIKM